MTISLSEFLAQLAANPVLAVTVALTLGVVLVNGWTDAPNAIATCVSTRAMSARSAILMAAVFNFLGVLVMTMVNASVAATIYNMVDFGGNTADALTALCAALVAIVAWATAAWWFGIPTSESHALIAGLSGAAIALHGGLSGVNGAEAAVNSGYVTLEIYFDVLADADDKEEYNSDVLANIFGIDLTMNYNKEVFELTNVQVAPGAFAKAEFTPYATANENGAFTIAQDMVNTSKVFRGENNLFATLTFQVNVEAAKGDYAFTLDETKGITVAHPEGETVGTSASDETVEITVRTLGDANGDGLYNVADSLMLSDYIRNPDIEKAYIPEYDMDKDGNIDFIDLDLLRKAIVGNNEYLTILVDPNEVAAEV